MGTGGTTEDRAGTRLAIQGLSRRAALTGAIGAAGMGALVACSSSAPAVPAAAAATAGDVDPAVAADLVEIHRRGHELWNERDLETFIPTFAPTIHYMEVASGHEITDAAEMIEFASKWFAAAPDAALSGVYFYVGTIAAQIGDLPASLDPSLEGDLCTVSRSTLAGTQTGPLPDGQPPTNMPFTMELAEFITYRENPPATGSLAPPWQATGGAMYFNIATLATQLGLAESPGLGGPLG